MEARRSVLDLRAAPLEGRSLAEAIQGLAVEFRERTGIAAQLDLVGASTPLPLRIEVGIYRIAQEALANVRQHAAASRVGIKLVVTPDRLQLTIHDNGRGFQPEAISAGHYGLIGINERVRLMGGKLDLQSSPQAGTQLIVAVPLEAAR
jgi:two-component system NarL family sensor kinase